MRVINISVIICMLLTLLCACSNKEETASVENDESYGGLGKYVYLDDIGIYHVRQSCIRLTRGKDEDGHEIYGKRLVDTAKFEIPEDQALRVCAHCVDDKRYERLIALSDRNKRNLANESRRWLYDHLVDGGYDMEPYDEFVNRLRDYDSRRQTYNTGRLDLGLDLGTFEEFTKALFPGENLLY